MVMQYLVNVADRRAFIQLAVHLSIGYFPKLKLLPDLCETPTHRNAHRKLVFLPKPLAQNMCHPTVTETSVLALCVRGHRSQDYCINEYH